MRRSPNLPKMEELVGGRVYQLHCRNLSFGVYDGKGGFIGIRTKFGDRYLFTEFHFDYDLNCGTVRDVNDTGIDVPQGTILACSLGSEDFITKRRVHFVEPSVFQVRVVDDGCGWAFVDTAEVSTDIRPVSIFNKLLFRFLETFEENDDGSWERVASGGN